MAAARVAMWVACVLAMAAACQGRLRVGYYKRKCAPAEYVVRAVVGNAVRQNPGVGAGIVRMFFHDCFVQMIWGKCCICT
uniref:Plant heme peroxidase family profile domain-containing protein n=1 Tax=Oryza glumipatula TaxID=40148 RepID=A0A0E0ANA4_9ORYZ